MSFETTERIESLNEIGVSLESPAESITDNNEFRENTEVSLQDELNSKLENFEPYSKIEYSECLFDAEVKEEIANFLESYDDIKFENWTKLSLEEKQEALQTAECWIANIEHRPPKIVQIEKMSEPGIMGYQDESCNKIALNSDIVDHGSMESHRKVIETLIHEGRHAYQHYNVDVCMIHESGSQVQSWRENFYNPKYEYYQSQGQKIYIPTSEGYDTMDDFRLYYYQPVEIDARNFASDVMAKLEAKGVVYPS